MAAGLGDFLQFTVEQFYQQQRVFNVYYYRVTSVVGLAQDYLEAINDWLDANVNTPVRAIQNTGLEYVSIEARNLTNNVDVAVKNLTATGGIAAAVDQRLPSWISASFRLVRESLVTRNGWKRFAGGAETQMVGNFWAITPALTAAIESALASDVVLGVVTVAEPVIIKRPLVTPLPTSHPYASIGGSIFRAAIGSQGSRKVGIGI